MCEAGDLAFYVSQLAVRLAGERPEDALAYAADTASNLDVSKCLWGRHSGYADVHQDKLDSNTRMNGMMTIYNALYKWDNEEQMVNDKKMERLIELVFNEKREQYKSPTFSEIRKEVNNLKDMYKEKAAGTYKSSPHPCPGNDLIAHDPDGCGCAKMQTLHEDFLIFATNQTTNLHCNVYPDDDGDGACDTRRGEEDVRNSPLLGLIGTRIVTYSMKAIDKGLWLASRENGKDFVWDLLRQLLSVRARTWMGREASYSGANPR
jgi:hypothetical protein